MLESVLLRNILSRLGAKLISYPLGFVASVLLVRYLGVERLGQYSYVSTFATLFGLLAGLGLPILLTREVARDKSSACQSLGAVMVLQYGLSALTLLLIIGSGLAFNPTELALPIGILGLSVALSAMSAPYLAMLNGYEKMHVSSMIEILSAILWIGLIVVGAYLNLNVTELVTLLLISPIVTFFVTKAASDRYCCMPVYTFDFALLKGFLVTTLPFALMVILNNIYQRIDIVMLEKMQSDEAVGIYSAAHKPIDALILIGANMAGVLYPRMAAQVSGELLALEQTIEKSCRYMIAIGIPAGVALAILAPWVVQVLYGNGFSASVFPLQILAVSIALMFMFMPLVHVLNATGREWYWVLVLLVNALVTIGLNLVLIQAYSAIGASVSQAVCELIALILVVSFVSKTNRMRYFRWTTSVLVPSALMGLTLWFCLDSLLIVGVVAGPLIYLVVLNSMGFFSPDEKVAFRQLFSMKVAR